VLRVGERVPHATVWLSTNETVSIDELAAEGPFLLLFYLFDWSST
jgi:peroxiredoxin